MVRERDRQVELIHVQVSLKVPGASTPGYQGSFLVDTGATDSMAAESDLSRAGIQPVGRKSYEMADGSVHEFNNLRRRHDYPAGLGTLRPRLRWPW